MNQVKQAVATGQIEMELQQAWSFLSAQKFELAKSHLQEAINKVDQLANIASQAPKPVQIDLIVEEKHEPLQLEFIQ